MKNTFLYLLVVLLSCTAHAQKVSRKKADELFKKRAYLAAAAMYEQLPQNDPVLLRNLGDCYYNNALMKDAAKAYGFMYLNSKDSISSEYLFKYAHALMGIENYKRADSIMSVYRGYPIDTPTFIANLHLNVPYHYSLEIMTKNITNGDFGLSYYGDKVAFASYRNGKRPEYVWNRKPYLDLFMGTVDSKEKLVKVEPFPEEINTDQHESSATFSKDGKLMFFCRTNEKRVDINGERVAVVRLMRAEFIDGKWKNIEPVSFSTDQYSVAHPHLTPDGKYLYFASDMPGGLGGFDLYRAEVDENGQVGTPVNLGDAINTPHREQFPFVGEDADLLYFASDGHQGMGGLDIFMARSYNGTYGKPLNLGETINSSADDFAFVVKEETNTGYLSSNRRGGDNLYSFVRIENASGYAVEGEVKDKNTHELLPGTTVSLYDEDDQLIGTLVVGEKADYVFATEPNKRYRIEATKDLYIPHSEYFTTNAEGKLRYNIELFVECYDDAEEIITRRADGKVQIVLENIYFDLNKWDIKPEAAAILDVLYDLLVKYPDMVVELGAHTDSRASNVYNMMLSNRRARATFDYLVNRGIKASRLKPKGYGEEIPLIPCGLDKPCTEQEHSINRRCEFIILK